MLGTRGWSQSLEPGVVGSGVQRFVPMARVGSFLNDTTRTFKTKERVRHGPLGGQEWMTTARRQNGYLSVILNGFGAYPVLFSQAFLAVTKSLLEGTTKPYAQPCCPTPSLCAVDIHVCVKFWCQKGPHGGHGHKTWEPPVLGREHLL